MPVSSSSSQKASKHLIELAYWTITDFDGLSKLIALVLVGRKAHAEWILKGAAKLDPKPSPETISEAIAHLTCAKQTTTDKYGNVQPHATVVHRDGWMLQIISWIVHRLEFPDALLRAPHSHSAGKGFDGLMLQMDGFTVTYIKLFEEKATDSPRKTVQQNVWPEFKVYEAGDRDGEMTAEASTLLELVPGLDVAELTSSSQWFTLKQYCATVATSTSSLPPRVDDVFKGYEATVVGAQDRRAAKLLLFDKLRPAFEDLAQRAIAYLGQMETS
jgi:hypothetical protein